MEEDGRSGRLNREASASGSDRPVLRTCQNCAAAKVKCHRNNNNSPCQRCQRLGKACIFRQALRRNNDTRKDMRIATLEAKVDQLLNASGTTNAERISSEPENSTQNLLLPPESRSTVDQSRSTSTTPTPTTTLAHDVISAGTISSELAATFIADYSYTFAPHFPFVVLPAQVTTERLRREKPFLLLAILVVSSFKDPQLQRRLCVKLKQTVSNRLILHSDSSFDMLQGLLVYLAWYHYYPKPSHYSQFLQLAISIVIDLNLDRATKRTPLKTPVTKMPDEELKRRAQPESKDEARALAGCYYLSSTVSVTLQKMPTFPHSVYIENQCKSLGEALEHPTDCHLLYIIQLQQLVEKINHQVLDLGQELSTSTHSGAALLMTFKTDLEIFKERLPFDMKESRLLFLQFHTTELALYQVSLAREKKVFNLETSTTGLSPRLDILRAGLLSAKSLLDFYLSLPVETDITFNNSEWIQMGFALIVAAKLSLAAAEPNFTRVTASLRESLHVSAVLKQAIERMSHLKNASADTHSDTDPFSRFEERIQSLQRWYDGQPGSDTEGTGQGGALDKNLGQDSGMPLQSLQPGIPDYFNPSAFMTYDYPYANGMFDTNFTQYSSDFDLGDYGMHFSYD